MEEDSIYQPAQPEEWVPVSLPEMPGGGALRESRAHLWALVLEARFIPSRVESEPSGWKVYVSSSSLASASREIRLFEEENRGWPPPLSTPQLADNVLATLSILLLLAIFHNVTRLDVPFHGGSIDWTGLGSADSGKILSGQWWRLVTALTLHSDWSHLVGNLAIGGFVIVFLARELGSGVAWILLLGSGIAGNLVNAVVQSPKHVSVGSSTMVFGAVGILAALSVVRYRHVLRRRWNLPIACALSLLALLGTEGKNTDLGAHFFGLMCGIFLGFIAASLMERRGRPGRVLNALFAVLSALVVMAAWGAALSG